MFANSIETISGFTRPIRFISRNYKSSTVLPGLATLFFINENGYALTCRHVVEQLIGTETINQNYLNFKNECAQLPNDNKKRSAIKKLEQKYNIKSNQTVQSKVNFPDCVDMVDEIEYTLHDEYDIAVIHFKGFKNIAYKGHAVLAKNSNETRPGDILCRLGFPFPEFTDFRYDSINDDIDWDSTGVSNTPWFPIDGMFTRHLADEYGNIVGIELSTPGLRGQSGGPLFSSNGIIHGVQSMTNHLHLGFDMVKEKMILNGQQEIVNNQPFLHVGQCVHINIIKKFLDVHNIKYYVGDSINDVEAVNA